MVAINYFLLITFIGTFANSQKSAKNEANFVFLTFHNNSDKLFNVNVVTSSSSSSRDPTEEEENGGESTPLLSLISSKKGSKDRSKFVKQFTIMKKSDPRAPVNKQTTADAFLSLWTAQTGELSAKDGTLKYQISDGLSDGIVSTVPLFSSRANASSHRLTVCVFGDFSENLYEHTQLDLSKLIRHQKCSMNLFIGKIAWERRLRPHFGFNFSPFVMLHSNAHPHKHSEFARVPSIFGAVGGNLTETTFFQSTEVGEVAFLQITVEIATVANLADRTVAYDMVAQYFRETMLSELECKLQELHRRAKRPWIVLYMTHPYLVSNDEDKTQWFIMNDTDRFFGILKRYKVDLLTSCGIEGFFNAFAKNNFNCIIFRMARILAKEKREMPEAKLPEYIQTTMAQCGGYQSMDVTLQNECSFAVLDINADKMSFRKMNADDGTDLDSGQIGRTFEEADDCVPDEEL